MLCLHPDSKSGRTFFSAAFASFDPDMIVGTNSAYGGTEPNEAPPKVLVKVQSGKTRSGLRFGVELLKLSLQ